MFIAKQGDLIIQIGSSEKELKEKLKFIDNTEISETDVEYELYNGKFLTQEEIVGLKEERINHLTMTALDLVNYVKKAGVPDETILAFLQANPSAQLQLTLCQNVYCGVVRQLCPIKITDELSLTDDQVVAMFKDKNNIA